MKTGALFKESIIDWIRGFLNKGFKTKKTRPKSGLKYPQESKGSFFVDGVPKDSGANNGYKFGGRLKLLLYPYVQ